jgi:hypothetical protein
MNGIERRGRIERTVTEWAASGLSAKAMAARAGVSEATLWRWKSRLDRTRSGLLEASSRTSGFLPVRVVESMETPAAGDEEAIAVERESPFELVFPDGARLVIPASFAADGLAQLLSVLRTC